MKYYKLKRLLRNAFLLFCIVWLIYERYNATPTQGNITQVEAENAAYIPPPEGDVNSLTYRGSEIPWQLGETYTVFHDNVPFFDASDMTTEPFEWYSDLDELGRCGEAYANICLDLMPDEPRGEIGSVKPSGWKSVKYDNVDGKYLYNRCHLIGFQLAGENANPLNLITGTRWLNVQGMLPFENMVADFVRETGEHVLYLVTPLYVGDELVARGVVMEAYSVESEGEDIEFCAFVYNIQPDISIDYATGESYLN